MDNLQLVLRKLVGPVISRTIPAIRRGRARLARGRCFTVPPGKTYIVLPMDVNYESAAQIKAMLERFWFEEGRDWEIVRTGPQTLVPQNARDANLICLGGPDQNPLVRELMQEHPELLRSVRYHGDAPRSEFHWQDRVFRADESTDFALLAVNRNPFTSDPQRRLVLMFGLGKAGTLAAATFYAHSRHARDRRTLQDEAATLRGSFEALLRVSHDAVSDAPRSVRAANRRDGALPEPRPAPAIEGRRPPPLTPSLAAIYDSLEQHRRRAVQSDLRFTLTVTRDFSLGFEEEVTIGAEKQDIVVFTKKIRGTPLGADEDIAFFPTVVRGADDLVFLPAGVLPSERRFLMFPLPPLVAQGPPRRIRLKALWPRACSSLEQPGGEDVNQVEVSEHVGPNVDRVTVTIRFEVPDTEFNVIPRFPHQNAATDAPIDPGTLLPRPGYGIHRQYSVEMTDVPRATVLEFRIVRAAQPDRPSDDPR